MKPKALIVVITLLPLWLLAQPDAVLLLYKKYQNNLAQYRNLFLFKQNPITLNQDKIQFSGFADNGFPSYKTTCTNIGLANTLSVNKVWPAGGLGLNLTGLGVNKLGMWDGGAIRATHKEFIGRVTQMDTNTILLGHSNNIAGILVAGGVDANAKGMAYQSNLKAWVYDNDIAEMAAAANGLLLSNHAYGDLAAWFVSGPNTYWLGDTTISTTKDWQFGFYDNTTKQWDSIAYTNPYYLIVKAVGNDRGNKLAPNTPHYIWNGSAWTLSYTTRDTVGPYDCVVTYGTAKNILSVGAVPIQSNGFITAPINTYSYSSWGPTDDGRIKPDVVTGTGTTVTPNSTHDSAYTSLGGTSGASAAASGSLYLLQQHYYNTNNKWMKAATLKGLAIHTADNCKATLGPNYESGWGLLNIAKAAQLISDSSKNMIREYSLNNTDSFELPIYINNTDTTKITISWTDPTALVRPPALNDSILRLVNDLDLRLINNTTNQIYTPFILNPYNPSAAATTGDNYRDNVEQIYATNLPTGFYTIKVKHKNTLLNAAPQAFAMIGSGFIATPQIASSNIVLANFSSSTANFRINSFTKGNGTKRLIIANSSGPVNALPVNGTKYIAKDTFGLGTQVGTNNYVVYNGTANSMLPVYNNIAGTPTYHIAIFDYNGDSTFSLYNTKSFAASSITLPVKWLSFNAENIDSKILLQWSTLTEINNNGFDIERSFDNSLFTKINFVKGVGNSLRVQNYQYTDALNDLGNANSFGNKIYYRLKQLDYDGAYHYSKTVSVDAPSLTNILFYPNPFSETCYIKINSNKTIGDCTLKVYDLSGQLKLNKTFTVGNNNIEIDLSELKTLQSGLYIVQTIIGDLVITKKIMKQ
ncbi:MAG: S8/S53 family peptidase [Bacteroidota bacterium]